MSTPSGYFKISDKFQLSAKSWDSVKNPNGTEKFMKDMRPLVTMLSYGKWLETYLDHKCKRHQAKAHASWMSSPDFSYNLDRLDTSSESRSDVVSETVTLVDPAGQEARAAQGRREPPGREPPDLPLISSVCGPKLENCLEGARTFLSVHFFALALHKQT